MSCGTPHRTPCAQVLAQVYDFLAGEVAASDQQLIVEHLDECAPCLRQYGLEQAVKALVQRSCTCEHAPERLRVQIVTRIRQISITYRSTSD